MAERVVKLRRGRLLVAVHRHGPPARPVWDAAGWVVGLPAVGLECALEWVLARTAPAWGPPPAPRRQRGRWRRVLEVGVPAAAVLLVVLGVGCRESSVAPGPATTVGVPTPVRIL